MDNLILIDKKADWLNLLPFTFTRPISKIRIGINTIDEKWHHSLQITPSYITEDYLKDKFPLKTSRDNIVINSCLLPDESLVQAIKNLNFNDILTFNNVFLAARVNNDAINQLKSENFDHFTNIQYSKEVKSLKYVWDIFLLNSKEITSDFHILTSNKNFNNINKSNTHIGSGKLFIGDNVESKCVIYNTNDGPIYIGDNAIIMEGSMIRGPVSIGEHSVLKLGSKIYPGTTIGPYCKVGGEINNTVIFGYSNKAHDGFLGNAVIGEWCNIGADTNNSNLKNNYESVKVWSYFYNKFIDTGQQFCGLFMGDHSKCAINTMFNTGTSIGICSNIFGSGFPRTFIPSFSWGGASGIVEHKLEKVLNTAQLVMNRRDVEFTSLDKDILSYVYEFTRNLKEL